MRTTGLNKIVVSFALFLLLLMLVTTHAVAASADLLKAKKGAEAQGYIFFATHDEIAERAKKEGKIRVMTGLESGTFKQLINGFKQKYPFITDIYVEEITVDAFQRVMLEIKAGQAKGWDIAYIPPEYGKEYIPYLMKSDLLGMAQHGVLRIDPRMIHPGERNIVSVTSNISVVAYNKKLISEDKVPAKWEDFLKPEFKGKKFAVQLRPKHVMALVPAWGLERTLDYARKLAAQQPVWGSAAGRLITAVAAREYSLNFGPNFAAVKRRIDRDPTGSLNYKIAEPVPTTAVVYQAGAILNTADNPHAALLWFEFLASPEGQKIIDKYEGNASVFTPGSAAEQVTRGKKLSVVDWNHFTKVPEWDEKLFEAFGFPKADK
ncbi:MAG: extracellular solute-binding protein [Deltaproteobacteria bacterium]|nr:extracellular solute-binding protein [Deltaproteobacteria bacterium]